MHDPARLSPRVLDNPIWESLVSRHRSLALRQGDIARYPADSAPFLAVAAVGIEAGMTVVTRPERQQPYAGAPGSPSRAQVSA